MRGARLLIGMGFAAAAVLLAVAPVRAASLAPCPQSPNCVSSVEPPDRENYIAPLAFQGPPDVAWKVLQETLPTIEGFYEIRWAGVEMLHAVFRTSLFGFKDDVQFLVDAKRSVIQVRSESRIGWFDFGVNRDRLERIRRALPPPFVHVP